MGVSQIRMLLAVNEEADRRWIRDSLTQGLRIEIQDARSLQDLRRASRKIEFDCILAATSLVEAPGEELVRNAFGSPMIVWSRFSDPVLARHLLTQGAEDFLVASETDVHRLVRAVRFAAYRYSARRLDGTPMTPHGTLEQLASSVAHGINNPASIVSNNLSFVRDAIESCRHLIADLENLAGAESVGAADIHDALHRHRAHQLGGELPTVLQEVEHGVFRIVELVKDLQSMGNARVGSRTEDQPH